MRFCQSAEYLFNELTIALSLVTIEFSVDNRSMSLCNVGFRFHKRSYYCNVFVYITAYYKEEEDIWLIVALATKKITEKMLNWYGHFNI